jgi:hypothetical protein
MAVDRPEDRGLTLILKIGGLEPGADSGSRELGPSRGGKARCYAAAARASASFSARDRAFAIVKAGHTIGPFFSGKRR